MKNLFENTNYYSKSKSNNKINKDSERKIINDNIRNNLDFKKNDKKIDIKEELKNIKILEKYLKKIKPLLNVLSC